MNKSYLQAIRVELTQRELLPDVDFYGFQSVNSTNQYLLEMYRAYKTDRALCVAEQQSAGRGRLGRSWDSSVSGNIYMSSLLPLPDKLIDYSALSLVAGSVLLGQLEKLGIQQLGLKWPNDVMYRGNKVAGILIELATRGKQKALVIGVGVNIELTWAESGDAWADLSNYLLSDEQRASIIVGFVETMELALQRFIKTGFSGFRAGWQAYDIWYQQQVEILDQGKRLEVGLAMGVNDRGLLQIQTDSGIKEIITGDVSLRRLTA